jgi:hypothetical protein
MTPFYGIWSALLSAQEGALNDATTQPRVRVPRTVVFAEVFWLNREAAVYLNRTNRLDLRLRLSLFSQPGPTATSYDVRCGAGASSLGGGTQIMTTDDCRLTIDGAWITTKRDAVVSRSMQTAVITRFVLTMVRSLVVRSQPGSGGKSALCGGRLLDEVNQSSRIGRLFSAEEVSLYLQSGKSLGIYNCARRRSSC